MIKKNSLFRVNYRLNGGEKFGLGHVYRAIHLHDHLKKKVNFFFIINNDIYIKRIFKLNKLNFITIDELNDIKEFEYLISNKPNLIIFDILNTNFSKINKYKKNNNKILSFEDNGSGSKKCDVVINSISSGIKNYVQDVNGNIKYIGPDYKVLSKNFDTIKHKEKRKYFLIILGGGIIYKNEILKIIDKVILIKETNLETVLVIGGAVNKNNDKFRKLVIKCKLHKIKLLNDPKNIKNIFLNSKIALIGGGGSLIYEMIRFHIPFLVIKRVKHQLRNINYLKKFKFLSHVNKIDVKELGIKIKYLLDNNNYKKSIKQMKNIVDGKGRQRVSKIIIDLCKK